MNFSPNFPLAFLSVLGLAACDGTRLHQGAIETRQLAEAEAGGVTSDAPDPVYPASPEGFAPVPASAGGATIPGPAPEDPLVQAPLPDRAAIPIAIGGASLTCTVPDPSLFQAECLALLPSGEAAALSPTAAYIREAQNSVWTSAPFIQGGAPGLWLVSLPFDPAARSFAISLQDTLSAALMDWVIHPDDPVDSRVGNGGFEALRFTNSPDYATQFIDASEETSSIWRVTSKTEGCLNILEISVTEKDPSTEAPEGTQWTELDSSCSIGRLEGERAGNNIALYQDLTVVPGQIYQLSYQFKRRSGGPDLQKLKVSFGGEVLVQREVWNSEWATQTLILKPNQAKARLQFEEEGYDGDGEGTLLDDVALRLLGSAPE